MHHISVTWHFRRCKVFFFWIPSVRRTICCHFHENRCYFIFSTLYNLNIYLWPLKPHNFKSMCRISKIITFLESLRQAGWFDLFESDIQALLIFDPLITLWGNFDAPYLKLLNDAKVASACFYVRTCRRVRNSKKIATIRDFNLPGSFLCQLDYTAFCELDVVFNDSIWNICDDSEMMTVSLYCALVNLLIKLGQLYMSFTQFILYCRNCKLVYMCIIIIIYYILVSIMYLWCYFIF